MPKRPDRDPLAEDDKAETQLKRKSAELKTKIEEEKKRHNLPLDSNLGDPNWEERAKDGHLDIPREEED